jgi:hypothetical protein
MPIKLEGSGMLVGSTKDLNPDSLILLNRIQLISVFELCWKNKGLYNCSYQYHSFQNQRSQQPSVHSIWRAMMLH